VINTKHSPPATTDTVAENWIAPGKTRTRYANYVAHHVNVEVPVGAVKGSCLAGGGACNELVIELEQVLKNSEANDARQPALNLLASVVDELLLDGCIFERQAP